MSRHFTPFPLICCGLLLLALTPMPYGYYVFLRIVICIWGITVGIQAGRVCPGNWASLLAYGIAILYNPLIRVPLSRDIWQAINVVTVLVILVVTAKLPARSA